MVTQDAENPLENRVLEKIPLDELDPRQGVHRQDV